MKPLNRVIRNPNCTLCPLHRDARYVCLIGTGNREADIMCIGEAPGKGEEFTRQPFSGPAGEIYDRTLDTFGLNREIDIFTTNVVKCRPQDAKGENKKPTPKQIDICTREFLTQEIRKVRPKIIIAMGAEAIYGVLGKRMKVAEARNIVWKTAKPYIPDIPVVCTYHPAATIYTDKLVREVLKDWDFALKVLRHGEPEKVIVDYSELGNDEYLKLIDKVYAIDLEWNGFDFFHHRFAIQSAQVSSKEGEAFYIDWNNHPDGMSQIKYLVENPEVEIVNHFLKHDLKALSRYGIMPKGPLFATEVARHLLDENAPDKGLDAASAALTPLKGHKHELQQYMKNHKVKLYQVPKAILVPYGCGDADSALRLRNVLKPRLEKEGMWPLFSKLLMPSMKQYLRMEINGCHIDVEELQRLIKKYTEDIKLTKKKCYQACHKIINLNSHIQIKRILYKKWELPAVGTPKKWNDPPIRNTAKATLKKLLKEQLTEEQRSFVTNLLEIRRTEKILSTYLLGIEKKLCEGNLIHSDFNFVGTETLRTSCRRINQQNIPRKNKDIKGCFTSRFGSKGRIVQIDLSQAELRWIAHLSQDPLLVKLYKQGVDVHTHIASLLYDIPESAVTGEQRFQTKEVNFGISYGMTEYRLSQKVNEDTNKKIFKSIEQARRFIDKWWILFPRVKKLMNGIKKEVLEKGCVTNLFGGKRHLVIIDPNSKQARKVIREAGNAPIQGGVSLYNRWCGLQAERRIIKEGLADTTLFINEVHDAWVLDTVEENLPKLYDIFMDCFTKPDLSPFGVTLTVPMEIEFSYGKNWKDLQVYKGSY